MSDWIDLYAAADLPPGGGCYVIVAEGVEVALFNVDGEIFATDNMCIHQGGPLGDGYLRGDVVACPWHRWEFSVRSGECLKVPGERVPTYETRVVEGRIQVRMPPPPGP